MSRTASWPLRMKDTLDIPHTLAYRHTDTLALLVRDIVPRILLLGTGLEETEGLYCGKPWEIESDNFPCFSA